MREEEMKTMETLEYRTIDKTGWGDGPWQDEPDKRQWQDDATGLSCLIVRGPAGAWCGYVGVPETHPYFGADYSSDVDMDVHGGLTFAGKCADHGRVAFEKWRARRPRLEQEARIYPDGDAAESLRCWQGIETYEAWAERCQASSICHLPAPGESDNVWWFGFDCAHCWDLSPKMNKYGLRPPILREEEVYRDIGYVTQQCVELARQLAAAV